MTVLDGCLVTFDYTLKDDQGEVIDTSDGGKPIAYTHGRSEIVPGLETELAGMSVGESKSVVVSPEQGYGTINEKAIVEVPNDRVPEDARQVGNRLQGTGPDGNPVFPLVKELRESGVVLDFNHPLAGMTLHFDVKIRAIEESPAEPSGGESPEPGETPEN